MYSEESGWGRSCALSHSGLSLGVKFEGGDPSLPTSNLLPGKKPILPVGGAAAPLCCPQFLEASQAGSRFDSLGPTSSTSALPQPGTLTGWGGGCSGSSEALGLAPRTGTATPGGGRGRLLGSGSPNSGVLIFGLHWGVSELEKQHTFPKGSGPWFQNSTASAVACASAGYLVCSVNKHWGPALCLALPKSVVKGLLSAAYANCD